MPVELLIARPATGKTQSCIQKVQSVLLSRPLSNVWVVVPDRLQAATFRYRLAHSGGAIGVHVGRFEDLYHSMLEQAGDNFPIASSPLLHFIIQQVINLSAKEGKLVHYKSLRSMPGFILALRDAFAELKRSLIFPERFIEYSQHATPAQQELAGLYLLYQSRLRELGWADPEGLSWLAVETLEKHPDLANSIQLLVVDGFDSFTGAQLRTLELLATQVGELLITFPGEKNSQRFVHRRFKTTLDKLTEELAPTITTLAQTPALPDDVLHLENLLFELGESPIKHIDHPFLLETRSPTDEAREALRWIKARVIRDGIKLSDCAIFTPNPNVYSPFIRSAAQEFGIPVYFSQGTALSSSPAITALLNLLNLPVQNFRSRALFNVLRSPYFQFGLDVASIDLLEEISRKAKIIGGKNQWQETWEILTPTPTEQIDFDGERKLSGLPRGEQIQSLQRSLQGCFDILSPEVEMRSQTGWVSWLEDLLDQLKFYEQASHERDEIACELLRETLRALVLSETVIGEYPSNYDDFISLLRNALNGASLPEPRLNGQPAILIGQIVGARGVRFKAVALLGFSEGLFPHVERSDPFLNESLREALGLESRLNREQAGLFYQAITRTDQFLLITRPYLSDSGEEWEASPFWKDAQKRFDQNAVKRVRPDDVLPLDEAASSQELLFWGVRHRSLPERFLELTPRWERMQYGRQILRSRRARQPVGGHEGFSPSLCVEIEKQYAPDRIWSASELEAYRNCPHQFYIREALDLEPRVLPELGWNAAQMGSMLHKLLETAYSNATNPGEVASVLDSLSITANPVFEAAPMEYGFRPSPLWEYEKSEFLATLQQTIEAIGSASEGWTPVRYEQKFGMAGNPPLVMDLGKETIRLRGVIDRVDRNETGEIRVVDYKGGSSHLDPKDLESGARLQLPIYALAAQDALQLGRVIEGFYWMIQSAKPGALKLSRFETDSGQGIGEAVRVVIEHLKAILMGIRAAEFPPKPPKGECSPYCPAVQWCWRYQPGWRGGK